MTVLPQIERELRAAAARRAARRARLGFRRGGLALLLAGVTATGAAAGSGWMTLERGESSRGSYEIRKIAPPQTFSTGDGPRVPSDRARDHTARGAFSTFDGANGSVCLEVRFPAKRPKYGCDAAPSKDRPIGLVVVDRNVEPGRRLTYGLVDETVDIVQVAGRRVVPRDRAGLVGRYFSAFTADRGPVFVVALGADGRELGREGAARLGTGKALSRDDARRKGLPAGFAPTAGEATAFVYKNRRIDPAEAARGGLSCFETESPVTRCVARPPGNPRDPTGTVTPAEARELGGNCQIFNCRTARPKMRP